MTIATFDPAQTSGDELRRSYVESGYVLVTGLVDEAARAEITRELRQDQSGRLLEVAHCGGDLARPNRAGRLARE